MNCKADCLLDPESGYPCIRPIKAPKSLVWLYFEVKGRPQGELEERKFSTCDCGCGNLVANPPVGIESSFTLKGNTRLSHA